MEYIICKYRVEAKQPTQKAVQAKMLESGNYDYEEIESFETLDEAQQAFKECKASIEKYETAYNFPVYVVTWHELVSIDQNGETVYDTNEEDIYVH